MQKKSRVKRFALVVLVLFALLLAAMAVYLADYSHPDEQALSCLESTSDVTVEQLDGGAYVFAPSEEHDLGVGFVLYPGAKVGYRSYAPLAQACAQRGITCIVVNMPLNLAVLDSDAAEDVRSQFPDITSWYLGGHSFGGVAASMDLASSDMDYKGLILLASYPIEDVSNKDTKVLSIHGTNDGVLVMDEYDKAMAENVAPGQCEEVIIEGGNHAQFGSYGEQNRDGAASISASEQVTETADAILAFITEQEQGQ